MNRARRADGGLDRPRGRSTGGHLECHARRLGLALLAAAAFGLLTAPAVADPTAADEATARALGDRGDALTAGKHLEGALAAYRGAHEILRMSTTGLQLAKAHEAIGQLVEAIDVALEVGRRPARGDDPTAIRDARAGALALAQRVEPRVPSLAIDVRGAPEGAAPTVEIDGVALPATAAGLPRRVNPGRHVVRASANGRGAAAREVIALEGQTTSVSLALEPIAGPGTPAPAPIGARAGPAPAAPPDGIANSPLVLLGFGAGAVGIAIGAVTGSLSLSRASDAKKLCDGTRCPPAAGPDLDAAKGLAWGSNIGFAIGAIGVGVGIVGIVIGHGAPPKATPALAITPEVGPGYAGVGGAF